MRKVFSHKSFLSQSAITLGVPPHNNRHQVISGSFLASVAAVGVITVTGAPHVGQTITIHNRTWMFVKERKRPYQVTIGATAAATVTNIVAAVNADFGINAIGAAGADGFYVTAADGTGDTVDVTWCQLGTSGNAIVFSEAASNLTMDGSGTMGGTTPGVGDGTAHDPAAGSGALVYYPHKAGPVTHGSAYDYTSGVEEEIISITGMIDAITVTPADLDADCAIRVIVNSWKE